MILFDSPKVLAIREIKKHVSVPVTGVVPTSKPSEFIRVLHTGGTENDIALEHHILVIEAFSSSEANAWNLIQVARGALVEAQDFYAYQLGNPYPNPNEDGSARYSITIGLVVRGTQT